MTTSFVSSPLSNTSDADFRAWGKQISDQLQAIGLVKTADTGQVNWTTVTRGTAGAYPGYEIYRFADALQSTAPIFFKIEYGSYQYDVNGTQIRLTVGTGTNGAGVINNASTAAFPHNHFPGRGGTGLAGSFPSYACYREQVGGFFFAGWCGAGGSAPNAMFAFGIFRSLNEDGTPNGEAACYYGMSGGGMPVYSWSFLTGTRLANGDQQYCMIPHVITSSVTGTEAQVFRHFTATPKVRPLGGLVTYLNSEIAKGSVITLPVVGSTPRSYLALGDATIGVSTAQSTAHVAAMIWE